MVECVNNFFIIDDKVVESLDFEQMKPSDGFSIYEVLRVINGKPLFLEKHLERLFNSASISEYSLWMDRNDVTLKVAHLIGVNRVQNGNIKILFNFVDCCQDGEKHFYAYFLKHKYPTDEMYRLGVETMLFYAERYNPNAKVVHPQLRIETQKAIAENNIYEVILVDRNGYITEGSKSNVFFIIDDCVFTAPAEDVLPGVTRNNVVDICKSLNMNLKEEKIHERDLKRVKSAFITGTSPKVLPINRINELKLDTNSKLLNQLVLEYNKLIDSYFVE